MVAGQVDLAQAGTVAAVADGWVVIEEFSRSRNQQHIILAVPLLHVIVFLIPADQLDV